jgi:hypothetical protein
MKKKASSTSSINGCGIPDIELATTGSICGEVGHRKGRVILAKGEILRIAIDRERGINSYILKNTLAEIERTTQYLVLLLVY